MPGPPTSTPRCHVTRCQATPPRALRRIRDRGDDSWRIYASQTPPTYRHRPGHLAATPPSAADSGWTRSALNHPVTSVQIASDETIYALGDNGNIFIPLDPYLNAAPGHSVPPLLWEYINRPDLFPGGWLHDLGLPVTEPLTAIVTKGDIVGRTIQVQAFQRAILTYDPLNPRGWEVERANVGRDYIAQFPGRP